METVVEKKVCRFCNQWFEITDADRAFYEKVSPVFAGKRCFVPSPTLCPSCRMQRRQTFRSERKLFKSTCHATQKDILSIYPPTSKVTVYEQNYWWSDSWDPKKYAREYDFSKPFFEQFQSFLQEIPLPNLMNFDVENAQYANLINDAKNCYLTFASGWLEDAYYCYWVYKVKNCFDCSFCYKGENSYGCLDCEDFYSAMVCTNCKNIAQCSYCTDCRDCSDCVGCVGISWKKFHIFNVEFSKEDYAEKRKNLSFEQIENEVSRLKQEIPQRENRNRNNENCTGEYIRNSKNITEGFDIEDCQDGKYISFTIWCKDGYDLSNTGVENLVYESSSGGYYNHVLFSTACAYLDRSLYCFLCSHVQDSFGCIWLKNAQYHIFNTPYSKEEYEALVPKIIDHMKETQEWGEFFPSSISPFGYNHTVAIEYFPMTPLSLRNPLPKAEESRTLYQVYLSPPPLGEVGWGLFTWSDYETPFPKIEKTIFASDIPKDILKIPNDILHRAIICSESQKPFKILEKELAFYKAHNISIPRLHPEKRHESRLKQRNSWNTHGIECKNCHSKIFFWGNSLFRKYILCENCYEKKLH